MGRQPDSHIIDKRIRKLIYLLNEIPYIQTMGSCSGHPDDPTRGLTGGFITLEPIGEMSPFWEFLNGLDMKLNRTDPQMLECAQQIRAKTVYTSAHPLVDISFCFSFAVPRKTPNHTEIWNAIIASVQSVLGSENHPVIKTPEEGMDFLINQFHSTPYVVKNQTKRARYGVGFQATWDYESCQWCFSLMKKVYPVLKSVLGSARFYYCNSFQISPLIKASQRSRKDHIKIWKLIEAAVIQLYPDLEQVELPRACTLDAVIGPDEKASYQKELQKHIELENLCQQAQDGDVRAYQLLSDETRQHIQEVLAESYGETEQVLEAEIHSKVMSSLHHFTKRVFFKTWVSRIVANAVAQKQYEALDNRSFV